MRRQEPVGSVPPSNASGVSRWAAWPAGKRTTSAFGNRRIAGRLRGSATKRSRSAQANSTGHAMRGPRSRTSDSGRGEAAPRRFQQRRQRIAPARRCARAPHAPPRAGGRSGSRARTRAGTTAPRVRPRRRSAPSRRAPRAPPRRSRGPGRPGSRAPGRGTRSGWRAAYVMAAAPPIELPTSTHDSIVERVEHAGRAARRSSAAWTGPPRGRASLPRPIERQHATARPEPLAHAGEVARVVADRMEADDRVARTLVVEHERSAVERRGVVPW